MPAHNDVDILCFASGFRQRRHAVQEDLQAAALRARYASSETTVCSRQPVRCKGTRQFRISENYMLDEYLLLLYHTVAIKEDRPNRQH